MQFYVSRAHRVHALYLQRITVYVLFCNMQLMSTLDLCFALYELHLLMLHACPLHCSLQVCRSLLQFSINACGTSRELCRPQTIASFFLLQFVTNVWANVRRVDTPRLVLMYRLSCSKVFHPPAVGCLFSIQCITSLLLLQSSVSELLLAVGCQSQCLTSGLLCESCWSGNYRAACKTATLDNVSVDILMRYFLSSVVLAQKICILNCLLKLDAHPKCLTFALLCQSCWC